MRNIKKALPTATSAACTRRRGIAAALLACAGALGLAGQASAQCGTYNVAAGPATFVGGVADSGNHCDDCTSVVTPPFPVSLYGTSYTSINVGSNGFIDFTTAHAGFFGNACLPSTVGFGPVILAHWDDLRTDAAGAGILTDTIGIAPNRTFVIEWRATYFGSGASLNFAVLLSESGNFFDVVYNTVPETGASATVGVQFSGTGPSTQFECNTGGISAGQSLRFTCAAITPQACCNPGDGTCTLQLQTACASPSTFAGGTCTPNNPCPQPAANDLCTNAIAIGALPYTNSVLAATTTDDIDTSCNSTANTSTRNGVWYKYTTGADAGTLVVSETGPNDVVIASFSGDCSNLTQIACFDAEANDNFILAQPNTTYYFLIGLWSTTGTPTGSYTISVTAFNALSGACCTGSTCTISPASTCAGVWRGANSTCQVGPQYLNSTAVPIPDYAGPPPAAPITVSSAITIPATDTSIITSLQVRLDLNMTFGGDLYIRLQGPGGQIVDLFKRPGTASCTPGELGNGNGLVGVYNVADSGATNFNAALIAGPTPLASGTYRPSTCAGVDTSLNAIFGGQPAAGTWTLLVSDEDEVITGTLNSFGLSINGGVAPCPAGKCCVSQTCSITNASGCTAAGGNFTAGAACTAGACSGAVNIACCSGASCILTSAASCTGPNTLNSGAGGCNASGNGTTPCCKGDYNHVGGTTVQDIFDFLAGYFTQNPQADANDVGGVSVQDIFDYLSFYFVHTGCP